MSPDSLHKINRSCTLCDYVKFLAFLYLHRHFCARKLGETFENGYSAVGQTCDALEALWSPLKVGERAGVGPGLLKSRVRTKNDHDEHEFTISQEAEITK